MKKVIKNCSEPLSGNDFLLFLSSLLLNLFSNALHPDSDSSSDSGSDDDLENSDDDMLAPAVVSNIWNSYHVSSFTVGPGEKIFLKLKKWHLH